MTTKLRIVNDNESNGDLILNGYSTCEGRVKDAVLAPGESRELWVTDSSVMVLTERWPHATVVEKANLGLATTGDLLDELRARAEISGAVNYRTVDSN